MSCQRSRFADAAASGCCRSADQTNIPFPSAAIPPANRCCRDQLQPSPICKCVRPFGNPLRSVETGLQNTLEVRTRATLQNRISTPKPKNDDFEALLKGNFQRKIISTYQHQNERKSAAKAHSATFISFMQPLQYDLIRFMTLSCQTQ